MVPQGRLPRDAFADRLASLDGEAFAAFLAALYAARGRDVERDGAVLRLRGGGDDGRLVYAHTAAGVTADVDPLNVDLVATARPPGAVRALPEDAGVDVSGPDDLYDLLCYGIEREVADDLCRTHLGRSVSPTAAERDARIDRTDEGAASDAGDDGGAVAPGGPPDGGGDGAVAEPPRLSRRRLLLGVALLVLLAVTAVGASGVFGGAGPIASPGGGDGPSGDVAGGASPSTGGATAVTPAEPSATPGDLEAVTSTPVATPRSQALERRYVGLSPTCERPPELVAVVVVGALRNNDRTTNDGIRTAWNFSAHASRGTTYGAFEHYLESEPFEPLYTYRRLEIGPAYPDPMGRAYQVTVTGADGDRHAYHLAFTRGERGSREGCWLLAGIVPQ